MQLQPEYDDVNTQVTDFLDTMVADLLNAGIAPQRICLDPGFGFGKTLQHNVAMLKNIDQFQARFGMPILAGLSRKSMLGAITGKSVEQRLAASIAASIAAVANGAKILRVHDVAETVDALAVWRALSN